MVNLKKLKQYYKNHKQYIFNLEDINENIGNKALNLRFLLKKGFKIPLTFVCSFKAFNLYNQGDSTILTDLKKELQYYIEEHKSYSVRSSANIEDESDNSFAGQFLTLLNQKGIHNILNNVVELWNSFEDEKPQTYRKVFSESSDQIKMGVIIQEMVFPEFSGVVFTRNPITGLNEIIIESIEGLGENLVQLGKTPERWVNKWGEWIELPPKSEAKKEIFTKIAEESRKIGKKYGEPVDLEWAYDGKNLYWLQLRQITTLKNNKLYSNKLSREFLPGMIKPLIWSVNIRVVNTSWKHIFEELIGSSAKKIDINQLAHQFYYRAYFNMKIMGDIFELFGMPRDLLENLAGIESNGKDKPSFKPSGRTLYYLPRILLFSLKLYSFSKYIEKFLKLHKKEYKPIEEINIGNLDEKESLEIINKLIVLNIQASYFVILTQLLNNFYNKMIKNKLQKNSIEFEGLNFSAINKRLEFSDPRAQISKLNKEFKKLKDSEKENIKKMVYKELLSYYPDLKFTKDFQNFLLKFGYLRDNQNDFSQSVWSENPDEILKMVIEYQEPQLEKGNKKRIKTIKKDIFKSPFSNLLFNRAMRYLEYRQLVTNIYSYGYGLFRRFYLRIGDLFVSKGLIKEKNDIFYMNSDEVKELIENKEKSIDFKNKITKRKIEMVKYRNIKLPEIIYDDFLPVPINQAHITKELEGVPTSKGYHVGPVKIVRGINDINKIQDGDIIAIPYSDVSWTPLFAKAKAVISESGGILSHCSIVAREYNIPAVVSVNNATLLKDNTLIAVDAYKGKISILEDTYKHEGELPELLEQIKNT